MKLCRIFVHCVVINMKNNKFIVNGSNTNHNTHPDNPMSPIKKLYRYIKLYYKKYKDFPSFNNMRKHLDVQRYKLIELLRNLEHRNLIIRKVSHYYLPEMLQEKDNDVKEIKINKKKTKKIQLNKAILIFKIFCAIIGFITFYISIIYSYKWFRNLLNIPNSILFSFAIVGFLIISFELIIYFVNNKKYIISSLFIFLWIITTLFSMSSTLAGQQKEMLKTKIKNYDIEANNKLIILNEIDKQINETETEIKAKRIERTKLLQFLNSIDNYEENKKQYKDINYRIYLKNKDLKEMSIKLTELKNKKISMLNKGLNLDKKEEVDFFKWLETIFKIKDYIFQFWLYLFPAIFIDLICPICFSIVFFLRGVKNEHSTKNQ